MMRKIYLLALALILSPTFSMAQSVYFDIGVGVGSATTTLDGTDAASAFASNVDETGVVLGLKLGYGPVANLPLYVVGELSGIGHRFYDDYDYFQFNSYLIGPGLIYYPIPLIQLAGSFGLSYTSNQTSLPGPLYQGTGGFAGNVSAAFDFGSGDHALLLGLGYAWATNTLENSGAEQKDSIINIFVRYAFRQKIQPEASNP